MFGFKKRKGVDVRAVVQGKTKALSEVADQVFSQGLVGQGMAIMPEGDTIYAPVSGTLDVVFPTGHAFGISDAQGLEYLLHIGIDTVNLKGDGFTPMVVQGQTVKQGDPLVKVDFALLREHGYACDTLVLCTTPKETCSMDFTASYETNVIPEDVIFHCEKK